MNKHNVDEAKSNLSIVKMLIASFVVNEYNTECSENTARIKDQENFLNSDCFSFNHNKGATDG